MPNTQEILFMKQFLDDMFIEYVKGNTKTFEGYVIALHAKHCECKPLVKEGNGS